MQIDLMPFSVVFLLIFARSTGATDSCSQNDVEQCAGKPHNKYTEEFNVRFKRYFQLIEAAKRDYVPCNTTNCGCYASVIKEDLKTFKGGISERMLLDVQTKGTKYQIINHKLYREQNCMFPSRCSGIEHFLLELLPKLPDMDLIINTRDWPQIPKNYGILGPVLSFSKTKDYQDIMYPAWSFWEGGPAISLYPRGIGRWDLHRKKLGKLGNETLWEQKITKGFFRGSRTSSERDALVILSREHPDLVDAQYTKNQAWKSDADTLHMPPAKEVTFEEHCKYKFLFNFRGVAASFRFKHVLLCKSLVFHVGDEWQEFFYSGLKPWIHFIPVDATATKEQIRDLLEFMILHEDLAKEIAENGYRMIWNNLKLSDVSCYWRKLLKNYAGLLMYQPKLDKTLIEITKY